MMNRFTLSFLVLAGIFIATACSRTASTNAQAPADQILDQNLREDIAIERIRDLIRETVQEEMDNSGHQQNFANEVATLLARRVKSEEARAMKGGIVQNTMIAETIIADTVETQQVDVVDSQGLTRLRLLGDHKDPMIGPAIVMLAKDGQSICYISENVAGTGLIIQDSKGTPVLQVVATKNGPVFGINDPHGKNRLMLFASEEGGSINFTDRHGQTITIDEKQLTSQPR